MKSNRTFLFLVVLLLLACSVTPALPTATPVPTATRAPTATPLPTPTPLPTEAPVDAPDTGGIGADGRYTAPGGSFSLIPPEGWEPTEIGLPYPALAGPQTGDFYVNFTFIEEETAMPEGFYSAQFQDMITQALPDLVAISETWLTNAEGEYYLRWEIEFTSNGRAFHAVHYFFESGGWALTATYTRLLDQGAENDPLADTAIDTLQFNK